MVHFQPFDPHSPAHPKPPRAQPVTMGHSVILTIHCPTCGKFMDVASPRFGKVPLRVAHEDECNFDCPEYEQTRAFCPHCQKNQDIFFEYRRS